MTVTTADVNRFEAEGRFDRIVSVEMFEHAERFACRGGHEWFVTHALLARRRP